MRVPSGIHGLDERIGGGLPACRAILVRGDAGAGKTAFGLHFLMEGVRRGEPSMLVSADGTRPPVSHRLAIALAESPLFTDRRGRRGNDVRQLASDLTREVRQAGARRLVIDDALALVGREVGADQADDFLRSLIASFEDNLGCTLVLTVRTVDGKHVSAAGAAADRLCSGVIELTGAPTDRWVQVRKMRGAPASLDPYFVGGLSAPRSLSANEPKPSACATLSRAV